MPKENRHDEIFKELITECFKEFMELFCPEEAKQIDFRTVHFLQQEMSTDHGPGEGDERRMDVVAQVRTKNDIRFVLIHVEHQSTKEKEFPKRMFSYYCQLWLRHKIPIYPIALFSDDHVWRTPIPDHFSITALGREIVTFNYELIKLKHLNWRDFVDSKNPIVAALITKMGHQTKDIPRIKAEVARILTGRKFSFKKLGYLNNFAEYYMPFPNEKSILEYKAVLEEYGIVEDEAIMVLSKSYQEKYDAGLEAGVEKGIEKGIENALFDNASKMLDKGLDWKLVEEITGLTRQKFQKLKKKYS